MFKPLDRCGGKNQVLARLARRVWRSVTARGRGARALRWTVLLSLVEVTFWLLVGSATAWVQNRHFQGQSDVWTSFLEALLSYVADHLGEITIGIATTAYVVFTYHILESGEAARRQASEPYATLRWYRSNDLSERRLSLYDKLAEDVKQWLLRTLRAEFHPEDVAGDRYLHIEISNARRVPLSWFQLGLSAEAVIPDQKPFRMRDQLRIDNLTLREGERLTITVLDFGPIPVSAVVSVDLETFVYGPVETEVVVDQYTGGTPFQAYGVNPFGGPRAEIEPPEHPGEG